MEITETCPCGASITVDDLTDHYRREFADVQLDRFHAHHDGHGDGSGPQPPDDEPDAPPPDDGFDRAVYDLADADALRPRFVRLQLHGLNEWALVNVDAVVGIESPAAPARGAVILTDRGSVHVQESVEDVLHLLAADVVQAAPDAPPADPRGATVRRLTLGDLHDLERAVGLPMHTTIGRPDLARDLSELLDVARTRHAGKAYEGGPVAEIVVYP